MKKMILLLTLSLTALMAIDFTMTKEGLFTNTTTQSSTSETVPVTSNPYLEQVKLPKCDANNPEVQFIRSNADWSTINSSKRIFCVSPGDYTSLKNIELTRSGTVDKRRYIILNNGNDLHPGKLNKSQLANFALEFKAANYWIIDRAASFDVGGIHSFILGPDSTHNVFNRIFTQNLFHTMWVRNNANYNTIQNSRFNGITKAGAEADLSTINILEWGDSVKDFNVFGTKVINNEFINVKAFRLNRFPSTHLPSGISQIAHFNGTVFDSNTIEFTDSVKTDCKGNYTPTGECMGLEATAMGIKGGSNDAKKPVIVSNNISWGSRPSDPTYTKLSSVGGFAVAYLGAENIHIVNNVIFSGTRGIQILDRYDMPRGTYDAVIKNNIIVDCGARPRSNNAFPLSLSMAQGMDVQDNLIKNPIGPWAVVAYNMYNNFVGNNVAINAAALEYHDNWEPVQGIDTNSDHYNTAQEAGYTDDFIFTTDNFTNKPREIILKEVIKPN